MSDPKVSVIIPCYNNARYLAEAIDSVLAQGIPSIEIIVVDDGSTDGSAEVASAYEGVTVIRQPNQGVGAARNRGLKVARGIYVAFLDADDIWASGKLAIQLEVFEADPSTDMVFAHIEEFVSDDLSSAERAGVTARPGRPAVRLPSTVLMTRRTVERIGDFEAGATGGDSIDWALRIVEAGLKTTIAGDALVYRRIHTSNNGRRLREVQRSAYLQALKRSLDRRRADEGVQQ